MLLRSWVLAQFCCDQSAVTVRLFASQSRAQLALLSRLGTTSRTMDSEYLFWAEFSFHDGEILPQTHVQKWSILNSYGNYLQGSVVVPGGIPACFTGSCWPPSAGLWRRSPCTPRARECIRPSLARNEGRRLPARFPGVPIHTRPERVTASL